MHTTTTTTAADLSPREALEAKIVRLAGELAAAREELKILNERPLPTFHIPVGPPPDYPRQVFLHGCIGFACPICHPQDRSATIPGGAPWDHLRPTCGSTFLGNPRP